MNIFRSSLFLLLSASLAAQTVTPRARAIHNSAIVVDTHADTPQRFLYENFDIGNTDPKDIGHISLDKARAGNLGAEFFSIWADPETTSGHFAKTTFDRPAVLHWERSAVRAFAARHAHPSVGRSRAPGCPG